MKLLADENIDRRVAHALKKAKFDIITANEAGLLGASDSRVIHYANKEERIILTHDNANSRSELYPT